MKQLIALFLFVAPLFSSAQTKPADTLVHRVKDLLVTKTYAAGNVEYTLVPVDDSARSQVAAVRQTVNGLTSTVNSLTAVSASQGIAITSLQNTVAGLQIDSPPIPKDVYDNTYTLTEADNGGLICVHVTCTITCPTLFAGFKCKIIRMGAASSATVTINGANSVYGYKRLLQQFADADINYRTNSQALLTGKISK